MSSLEHSAQNIQSCLAAAAASIATDQNQLIAAVCSARTHVQTAAKKLQDAKTACAKIAVSAAAAPGINICDCASAARGQRDELLSLVGQLQELAEFVTVTFVFPFLYQANVYVDSCHAQDFKLSMICAVFMSLNSRFRQLLPTIRVASTSPPFLLCP